MKAFAHKDAWMGALLGGIAAAIVNTVIFYIANAVLSTPIEVAQPGTAYEVLTAATVIAATLLSIVAAGIVISLLGKFTKKPEMIFIGLAVIVFLVSLSSPMMLDISNGAIAALVLMHVVASALITLMAVMKLKK